VVIRNIWSTSRKSCSSDCGEYFTCCPRHNSSNFWRDLPNMINFAAQEWTYTYIISSPALTVACYLANKLVWLATHCHLSPRCIQVSVNLP